MRFTVELFGYVLDLTLLPEADADDAADLGSTDTQTELAELHDADTTVMGFSVNPYRTMY